MRRKEADGIRQINIDLSGVLILALEFPISHHYGQTFVEKEWSCNKFVKHFLINAKTAPLPDYGGMRRSPTFHLHYFNDIQRIYSSINFYRPSLATAEICLCVETFSRIESVHRRFVWIIIIGSTWCRSVLTYDIPDCQLRSMSEIRNLSLLLTCQDTESFEEPIHNLLIPNHRVRP